jgi:uncharacterized membrane protein YhaH (DUF805 family)
MNSYMAALRRYAEFSGRSRRSEFWIFALVNFLVSLALGLIEAVVGLPPSLSVIYALFVLIPWIAVTVRRLHDTDRSGWWILVWFVPVIGFFVMLLFMILEGTKGPNRFGPDPKAAPAA